MVHGWEVNLSGKAIPVYEYEPGNIKKQIGIINDKEAFIEGTQFGHFASWMDSSCKPVYVLDANHNVVFGVTKETYIDSGDFSEYASDGSKWNKVSTCERKVVKATKAYDSTGKKVCNLPVGSIVTLTKECMRGESHPNYVSVEKVVTASGEKVTFDSNNGFVDLCPSGCWVNVNNILLRKI